MTPAKQTNNLLLSVLAVKSCSATIHKSLTLSATFADHSLNDLDHKDLDHQDNQSQKVVNETQVRPLTSTIGRIDKLKWQLRTQMALSYL